MDPRRPFAAVGRRLVGRKGAALWRAILVTGIVLVPVAFLNVYPRVEQLRSPGTDSGGWAIVAVQTLFIFLLSQLPFAIKNTQSGITKGLYVLLAVILMLANMSFSIHSIGLVRDHDRDRNRQIAETIRTLSEQRKDKTTERDRKITERKAIPSVKPTSAQQIADARKAVEEARADLRAGRCDDVFFGSSRCKKIDAAADAKQKELDGLEAAKAAQDRGDKLDADIKQAGHDIKELDDKLEAAGPPPLVDDAMASRIASWTFGKLTPEDVAEKYPVALSFVAELVALFGSFVLTGAFKMRSRDDD